MDYLHFFFFFFLATLHSMWDLSSPTRYQTWAPALEVWSLNHWTTREVPHRLLHITYLKSAFSLSFFPFSLIYLFIYLFFLLIETLLSLNIVYLTKAVLSLTFSISSTHRKISSLQAWEKCASLFSSCVHIFIVSQLQSGPFGIFSGYKSEIRCWKNSVTFLTLGLLSTLWFCFTFFKFCILTVRSTYSKHSHSHGHFPKHKY